MVATMTSAMTSRRCPTARHLRCYDPGVSQGTLRGLCECAVAVATAIPMLQERADWLTPRDNGGGVVECIQQLLASDLREREPLDIHRNLC